MTLDSYSPNRLNDVALRLLDLSSQMRGMARRAQAEELREFPLHDKKALEWLAKLEDWAQKTETDFELALVRNRGARRAAKRP